MGRRVVSNAIDGRLFTISLRARFDLDDLDQGHNLGPPRVTDEDFAYVLAALNSDASLGALQATGEALGRWAEKMA